MVSTATTHWKSLDLMSQRFPRVKVDRRRHVVTDGKIITSAGISAGIDLALHIVERYFGKRTAHATARHMEYSFTKNNRRRVQLKAASKTERKIAFEGAASWLESARASKTPRSPRNH